MDESRKLFLQKYACVGWRHGQSLSRDVCQRTVRLMDRWPIKPSSLMLGERGAAVLLLFHRFALPPPSSFLLCSFPDWVTALGQTASSSAVTWSVAKAPGLGPERRPQVMRALLRCPSSKPCLSCLWGKKSVGSINSVLWQRLLRGGFLKASCVRMFFSLCSGVFVILSKLNTVLFCNLSIILE